MCLELLLLVKHDFNIGNNIPGMYIVTVHGVKLTLIISKSYFTLINCSSGSCRWPSDAGGTSPVAA